MRLLVAVGVAMVMPGCGVFWAGAEVPVEIRGTLVDPAGEPLQNVRVGVGKPWAARAKETLVVDGAFALRRSVYAEGHVSLAFEKEGYYPRRLWVGPHSVWRETSAVEDYSLPENQYRYPYRSSRGGTTTTPIEGVTLREYTDPRELGPQQVVLDPHSTFTTLDAYKVRLVTRADGSALAGHWLDGRLNEAGLATLPTSPAADGIYLFLDAQRRADGSFVTVHVPGYGDRYAPPRLRLAATGEGNGFVRKTLEPYPSLARQMKEAPADGYGEAVFPLDEVERLLRLRENRSWFYVRLDGRYGRGCIETFLTTKRPEEPDRDRPAAVGAYLYLWMQPDGSRNLETRP